MKNISFCCYGWNVSVLLKNHEQNVGMIFFPEWIRQHQKCKIRYLKNIIFSSKDETRKHKYKYIHIQYLDNKLYKE